MIKTQREIYERLEEVCADSLLKRKCETTDTNVPVALMQVALETERSVLRWVLGLKEKTAKGDVTN